MLLFLDNFGIFGLTTPIEQERRGTKTPRFYIPNLVGFFWLKLGVFFPSPSKKILWLEAPTIQCLLTQLLFYDFRKVSEISKAILEVHELIVILFGSRSVIYNTYKLVKMWFSSPHPLKTQSLPFVQLNLPSRMANLENITSLHIHPNTFPRHDHGTSSLSTYLENAPQSLYQGITLSQSQAIPWTPTPLTLLKGLFQLLTHKEIYQGNQPCPYQQLTSVQFLMNILKIQEAHIHQLATLPLTITKKTFDGLDKSCIPSFDTTCANYFVRPSRRSKKNFFAFQNTIGFIWDKTLFKVTNSKEFWDSFLISHTHAWKLHNQPFPNICPAELNPHLLSPCQQWRIWSLGSLFLKTPPNLTCISTWAKIMHSFSLTCLSKVFLGGHVFTYYLFDLSVSMQNLLSISLMSHLARQYQNIVSRNQKSDSLHFSQN
ncbi:hypothetical protein VP01_32g8 [Puccinia sorghi]|uniref:Uncharacterized protein n=1 Tax=Puccinia sorghi TaxID=27349 RepID=A0A0L6UYA5_9BASI|nr:hypothetical protein VP01_32g8 [Puccinia sorghi]